MTEVIPWRTDTAARVSAQDSRKSSEQTRIEKNLGACKLTVLDFTANASNPEG